jgi:hypothetical protein
MLGQDPAVGRGVVEQPVDVVHRDLDAAGLRERAPEDLGHVGPDPVPRLDDVAYAGCGDRLWILAHTT